MRVQIPHNRVQQHTFPRTRIACDIRDILRTDLQLHIIVNYMLLKVADSHSEGFSHSHRAISDVGLSLVCEVNNEFACAPVITPGKLSDLEKLSLPQYALTSSASSIISTVAYNAKAAAQKTSSWLLCGWLKPMDPSFLSSNLSTFSSVTNSPR